MSHKEVKKSTKQEVKKIFLLNHIIESIDDGKNPARIARELGMSKQNIAFYIRQLKKQGAIEKLGYGVWKVNQEVKKSTKDTRTLEVKKHVRGHAFIWKVKIHKTPSFWEKRAQILLEKGYKVEFVGIKRTPRVIFNNRKIWLTNKGLIVYDSNSFFGSNAVEGKKYAVHALLETLREVEEKLHLNLRPYTFSTSREHYAIIKNALAIQCNRNGEKIHVFDNGERWLMVDDSLGQGGELETEGKNALPVNKQMQDWWNDNKSHGFKVTPTFVMTAINSQRQNLDYYAEHLKSHVASVQELGNSVRELTRVVKELKK